MKSTIFAALSNKAVIATLVTATVAAGGVGTYALVHNGAPQNPETPTPAVVDGPSKDQERQEAEAHKDEVVKEQQESKKTTTTTDKKTVTPVIVNASSSGVSGYSPGVVEDGGTCTWTFIKGSLKVTKTVIGVANVSNSTCPYLSLSKSDLPEPGDWKVTLAYSSSTASGTSAEGTVTAL